MDFEKLTSFETNGIQVTKYKSKQTGLTVIIADVEGPLVEGAFVLSTEAHDDFGLPHTLEHLIFLGSELYPYKGILDGLANRCLAQGTNAWTDTDHTAYTLTTAGQEGFLNLLPVYLDHVLYPTLTDSGFVTEVHHITGEGQDAGVVYCEMQGRENSQISLVYRSLLQHIYPGDCGYRYETGGIMKDLRSLTVHQVRQYHRDFYRPDNLCLVISGKVNPEGVFKVLDPVQQRILGKGTLPPMKRPWSDPVPPLTQSITHDSLFPSDDEETGMVIIGWRGPNYSDFNTLTSLKTLWKYLTDTAVSYLYKIFVEIEDPYCTDIYYGTIDNSVSCQYVRFENVPSNKIKSVKDKLMESLTDIITKKNFDMNRIKDIIEKCILEHMTKLEESPHRYVQFTSIGHFLYANQDQQLNDSFQEINRLNLLKDQSVDFWLDLIKKYLLDQFYICINGIPSIQYSQELRETEENRIKEQIKILGEEKLKELATELEQATKKNETPIPSDIMTNFKVPDVSNIPFFPISTVRNNSPITLGPSTDLLLKKLQHENCPDIPFFIQFDNLPSNFVELRVLVDTSYIPPNLKNYLEIYLDTFFELPILRNNVLIPYEDVVTELNRDIISYSCSTGIKGSKFDTGSFGQLVSVDLKLQSSKYKNGIQWLKDLLWHSQFSPEKLKINITKLLNDIPQRKRKGHTVNKAILQTVNFDNITSNQCITSILNQAPFLHDISNKLESKEGTEQIVKDLTNLRTLLLASLRVQVIANFLHFDQDIQSPWLHFLPSSLKLSDPKEVPYSIYFRNKENKSTTGYIVGIGAIDNSFLIASSDSIQSYKDPLEAALWVIDEYLTGMESPFWKKIRGLGYSYGYGNSIKIEEGLIYFTLSRSTNVVKAYEVAQSIIKDLRSRQVPLDLVHLESAKSGAIFSIVSREENIESAGLQSILNYLKNLPSDSNKTLLRRIQQVTPEDIYQVLDVHISPLFQAETSNIVIATNPSQIPSIVDGFKALNRSLQEKSI